MEENIMEERREATFRCAALGIVDDEHVEQMEEDGNASDDDPVKDECKGPGFSKGMARAKKLEATKPLRMGIILKLVGWNIGYQYFF